MAAGSRSYNRVFSKLESTEFQEAWGGTNTGLVRACRQHATAGVLPSGMLKDSCVCLNKRKHSVADRALN